MDECKQQYLEQNTIDTRINQQSVPFSSSSSFSHHRRPSDGSTFASSSYGDSPLVAGSIPLPEESGTPARIPGCQDSIVPSAYNFAKAGSPSILEDTKEGMDEKP